jgi:ABC-type Zn2+ transport system substrate-binding protein/surface adhesin
MMKASIMAEADQHDHEKGRAPWRRKHDHESGEHHGEAGQDHDEDHHEHAGLDPHIWLSPPLVKIQARTILAALQRPTRRIGASMKPTSRHLQRRSTNWTPI